MKNLTKILFLFTLICFFSSMKAQNYYDTQWKKIADNYSKGTYKSNLPLILDIQNRAIKEDNTIQLIKSLKAEFSIANLTNDDTKNDAASQFFKKLESFDQKLNGENKLVFSLDTRYRGVLDFGYKVAPVLGIAPNSRHVGAVRDRAEQYRTPKSRTANNSVFGEKGVRVIADTQFYSSRKKIKCFHNSVV